ncbi:Uncharacterized protein FWK35_00027438 [Aphis craccivora]|uniref:Uncharacterized protein n=1 Tax=Aphis craccivora TaxID=307492 RepID=A0A6G0ZDS7_APHCR|nr:Uncharacterized protein FWK35_00027438 [Aphis craccivora]
MIPNVVKMLRITFYIEPIEPIIKEYLLIVVMVVYSYVRKLMRFHHNPDTITTDNNVLVEMIFIREMAYVTLGYRRTYYTVWDRCGRDDKTGFYLYTIYVMSTTLRT